jgi:hypothetical protein
MWHRSVRLASRVLPPAIFVVALILLPSFAASAHVEEEQGDLTLALGFGTEPAYLGEPNSVQVLVHHGEEPVTDLGGDVDVTVSFGDASTTLPLEPNFEVGEWGIPGDYRAWFIPSEPGSYTFALKGEIDGQKVDVSVSSSPSTFSDVVDTAEAAFPPVQAAPTAGELADRIEAESAQTADAVAAAEAAAASADDAAGTAKTLAVAGVLVGIVGLIVGVVALVASRRRP